MPSVKELTSAMRSSEKKDVELVARAYAFAEKAHAGHTRYSGEPFLNHLFETAQNLAELGMDATTIAAGLLHDSIEDTDTTAEEIEREFGDEILALVEGVTKLGELKYRGMKRHTESLRKLFVAMSQDLRVLIIKFADRLHNMKTLEHVPAEKQKRIAEETLEIYAPLAYRLGMRQLNRELEDLAFPFVNPQEHKDIVAHLETRKKDDVRRLEKALKQLKKSLAKEKMTDIKTDYRIKGLYSLHRKWLRKGKDFEKIYDISAIRVVVPTIADCYRVLGLVHKLWRPLPGRIKDYIAFPKPNGYRSIHTTVLTGDGGIIEVQIRTKKMHRETEYGVASHLVYKDGEDQSGFLANLGWVAQFIPVVGWLGGGVKKEAAAQKRDIQRNIAQAKEQVPEWVKQLALAHEEEIGPEEFLNNVKRDFFEHRIFIFTPQGDVVDLPIGSTPVDFAYAIHSDIGAQIGGAKVNGKLVSLDSELHNGDIVGVQKNKGAKPKRKWLEFVKTDTAKRKIRAALEKENN